MNIRATMLLLLVVSNDVMGQNTYEVYVPRNVRPMTPFTIAVKIIQSVNPVKIEATLKSKDFNATSIATIESGESKTINMKEVPPDYNGDSYFQFEIMGTDSVTDEILFLNETEKYDIQLQRKFLSIFIQTDKAIYQPGQTIKFRAVVTRSDLKPLKNADGSSPIVKYTLIDAEGNTVLQNSSASLVNGVVGAEFKLGRYVTLGSWTVEYTVHHNSQTMVVKVEEYKLPKVRMQIITDQNYLHPKSDELTGEVKALFTFGQPVKGSGRIELTIDNYYGDTKTKIVQKFPVFNGSASFSIETKDIKNILRWNSKSSYSEPLKITAYIKDKNTGDEYKKSTLVSLKSQRLKFEAIATPHIIKPGLPYIAYIQVTELDGTLLSAEERNNFPIFVDIEYSYEWVWDDEGMGSRKKIKRITVPVKVDEKGIAKLNIIADTSDFIRADFKVEVPSEYDENQFWMTWVANVFLSPSNTFIDISSDDITLNIGDRANLTVYITKVSENYWFTILSKGKFIKQEIYTPAKHVTESNITSFQYNFDVTREMAPNVIIMVSFVRDDSEIVADSVKIPIRTTLANQVNITTSTVQTDVRLPVNITINAEPGSFFGLRAIDQSVLLLRSGNDITQSKILKELDNYEKDEYSTTPVGWSTARASKWWPYPVHGNNVAEIFENLQLIVLTDALLYRTVKLDPCRPINSSSETDTNLGAKIQTRNYFPETWIWTQGRIGDDGSATLTYDTPDTITTWELSSFAISDTKGLGVTGKNSEITVFRNFFISLNLPPTMVRGETLNMRTTIFNYFEKEIKVTVMLKENEWYDLVIIGDDKIAAGPTRNIKIPKQDSVTVVFPITFKKVGIAKIFVNAVTSQAGDAVERTMVVKPEGIRKIESHSTIIDKSMENNKPESVTFPVNIPTDAVQDSAYVKFSVSGNILGNALSNLGNLLTMPSGCGEQTMVSFAPDVYISLYLKETGELKGETKRKSEEHIRAGYINELRYQRTDGSFSAFGQRDSHGSTWLTAFVLKCFIAAQELDSDYIDKWKLSEAVNYFLLNQQNDDGSFREPGILIHRNMQGGVNSKETLSSYVLIALLEKYTMKSKQIETAISGVQTYLESQVDSVKDLYSLSIMTYALTLAGSDKAGNMLKTIDKMATIKDRTKFWEKSTVGMSKCEARKEYCPLEDDKSNPSSIEMTAYNLLTYLKMGRKDVMPIIRWLIEQRGAFGGYQSTQDTVMAIQALATVAGLFSERTLDLDITVTHSAQEDFVETFKLQSDNQIVLQMADLPAISGDVKVSAVGHGFADVQLTVWYNLPVAPKTDDPFIVDVRVTEKYGGERMSLVACSRINGNRKEVVNNTGMFVITGNLPSGYTAKDKEATEHNKQTKLIEFADNKVTGYFDELPKGKTMCMKLDLTRFAEVSGIKPQLFQAYDYYEPVKTTSILYSPLESEEGRICASCGSDCVGCPPKPVILDYCKFPCSSITGSSDISTYCDFPCPDYMDGLYYDSGSHIYKLMQKYSKYMKCKAPKGTDNSELYMGPPASLLNGASQYIECTSPRYFKRMLSSRRGFTISMLMYQTEEEYKRKTIFTIGSKRRKTPFVSFEIPQSHFNYALKIRLNGFEYVVDEIDQYNDIKTNKWTMVTVRMTRKVKAEIFLNGVEKGSKSRRRRTSEKLTSDITLKMGQPFNVKRGKTGNFEGLVSTLYMWSRPLTDTQILDLYYYINPLMTKHDPRLSKTRVHQLVPKSLRQCFPDSKYDASDLKKRAGNLDTACSIEVEN